MTRQEIMSEFIKQHADLTPRAKRTQMFADYVQALVRDFVPRDHRCLEALERHIISEVFEQNLEIISVPPEHDHMVKHELERLRCETTMATIIESRDLS